MKNFHFLPHKAWSSIIKYSASWEQRHNNFMLCYRVTYPNRFGLSIIKSRHSDSGRNDLWEVRILKDGELYRDSDGNSYWKSHCTDYDVVAACEYVRNVC